MSMRESFQETFIKLAYEPCQHAAVPKNCREVVVYGDPDFLISPLEGIAFKDAALTIEGVGGVILLVQLTGYLRFQLGFAKKNGLYTFENHFVIISMPMAFKLEGPRMAASIAGPWQIKVLNFSSMMLKAARKMQEVEKVTKLLLDLRGRKGFCPSDLVKLKADLRALEKLWTHALDAQKAHIWDDSGLARIMEGKPHGAARFAGARKAWA